MRWPRIELGSTAWKATMLTITPPSHIICMLDKFIKKNFTIKFFSIDCAVYFFMLVYIFEQFKAFFLTQDVTVFRASLPTFLITVSNNAFATRRSSSDERKF